ncbi:hypothetical protein [Prevotella merdae]|uniref:hypothetical protein n=1 Tax=Prevotella merdae TaxID=2079531 RepID=UPI003F7DABE4
MATLLARGQITIAAIRDGKDGADGKPGKDGAQGTQGEKGEKGDTGFSFANGKSMFKDLLFDEGYNGCRVYNNLNNGNVKLSIISKSSDNPYSIAKKELKIETTGAATPGHGGVVQTIMSRANAVFVRRVIAKIPKGYTLDNEQNSMGTGRVWKWLTPKVGTGVFTEYMYMYQCGASGSFSSGGFMYLYGGATATADKPVVWYIASCETYDMTAGSSAQIKSTEVMYATSTSGTSAPTSGWQKNIPTVASGSFLWSRFTVTYMDGSNAVSYNVSKMGDRGPQGPTGTAGKDAVTASFSPAALTFSAKTDSNGNAMADTTSGNTATITMLEGSSKVTGTYSITSTVGCTATISGSTVTVKSVAHDTIDGRAISRTSASVTVKCVYNGKTCYVDLPISVSVSAVWGGLVTSQKGLESKYTEISNKYNALPLKTQGELTQYTSSIKQSAREISLKVGETVVGRHNLLTGSAFERKTDYWTGNDSYMPYISVLNNYKGYNSVVIEGKSGTNRGVDFIRVKVNAARKNVVSAMLKCSGTVSDGDFNAYILQRDGSMADLNKNLFIPLSVAKNMIANEWMLAAETLTLDANTAYIDCVFLYYGTKTAYIACPQIAEGEEYAGYTLSEQDRGYIGGNLLINTDTLVKPDTLSIYNSDPLVVDSTHTSLVQEGNANKYGSYATLYTDATSAEVNTIRWNLKGMNLIKQGQMYMLSFVAKGTGKVCAFLYNDGTPLVSTEASGFTSSNQSADGNALITLTSSWQRYFVFWRIVGDKLPIYVLFRAMKGSKLYLSQPKLEYGATVTEYRAEKTGYVEDKSIAGSLLDAGIDITSRQIILTADKTMFRTTKGTNVAVFDESGINAQLVRAQRLQTKGKNGAEVRIEDGMVQIFGAAGVANIRFGLDDNGYATLGYYDNDGNLLYDLGPKGIVSLNLTKPSLTRAMYIDLAAAGLTTPYYSKKDGYNWISDANNNKVFGVFAVADRYVRNNLGVSKGVELYQYRAPCINGEIAADSTYNLTKAQAKKANGCYFTSNQIQVVDDKFLNIAKGAYLPWDTKTVDNTKYRLPGGTKVPKLLVRMLITQTVLNSVPFTNFETVYGGGVYVYPENGMDFSA